MFSTASGKIVKTSMRISRPQIEQAIRHLDENDAVNELNDKGERDEVAAVEL
jgi:DNA-binding transcriptional regulator GbsR (MarR family)